MWALKNGGEGRHLRLRRMGLHLRMDTSLNWPRRLHAPSSLIAHFTSDASEPVFKDAWAWRAHRIRKLKPATMKACIVLLALGLVAVSGSPRKHVASTDGFRIVGGQPAVPHSYPGTVTRGGCGAAVIADRWVMSAAHCGSVGSITAGDHDRDVEEGTEQVRQVVATYIHPRYNQDGLYSNDVSLHELAEPLEFNDYVQPLRLPARDFAPTGDATVVGWGSKSPWRADPLHEVTVPLVDNELCNAQYNPEGYTISPDMICAGEEGKDSCQGDSGGPMMCATDDGWVSCGIVSWGLGCGRLGFAGVYARTSVFIDWIEETMNTKH